MKYLKINKYFINHELIYIKERKHSSSELGALVKMEQRYSCNKGLILTSYKYLSVVLELLVMSNYGS